MIYASAVAAVVRIFIVSPSASMAAVVVVALSPGLARLLCAGLRTRLSELSGMERAGVAVRCIERDMVSTSGIGSFYRAVRGARIDALRLLIL